MFRILLLGICLSVHSFADEWHYDTTDKLSVALSPVGHPSGDRVAEFADLEARFAYACSLTNNQEYFGIQFSDYVYLQRHGRARDYVFLYIDYKKDSADINMVEAPVYVDGSFIRFTDRNLLFDLMSKTSLIVSIPFAGDDANMYFHFSLDDLAAAVKKAREKC